MPALLAGCATTETTNPVPVAYDLGPDDSPLPESVAVLPMQSSGEPVVTLASYAPAPETSQAVAAAAGAVSAPSSAEAPVQMAGQMSEAGQGDPSLAASQAALPEEAVAPVPSARSTVVPVPAKDQTALASQPRNGIVMASVTTGSETAAFSPASYLRLDDPRAEIEHLITKYAAVYEIPADLVRRVVKRESNFNPSAFSRGHYGLMQIKHATARGMGYQGPARGLFDAETNLKYAVKYLRGAYLVAAGDHDRADRLYRRGYYYDAKRLGLLDETGLGRDRVRHRQPQL